MKYTFSRRCGAFTATGRALVYVPDQVVADQQRFRNQSFTVMRRDGSKTRAPAQWWPCRGPCGRGTGGCAELVRHRAGIAV